MAVMRPVGVDLFAGAGGMTLGFEQAGFDVLAAVELDPIHCAVHEFNFPFWRIFCRSAAEITGAEIRQKSAIGDRDITVVFGGPPCQGCSTMGKRALDDPRNDLMRQFIRLVGELQPNYCVMENVRGLTLGKHRQLLDELVETLGENGYAAQFELLNAAHFGVPQDRQRLFLIGCRQGQNLPSHPSPIVRPAKPLHRVSENSDLPRGPTVAEAIADLPEIEQFEELFARDWVEVTGSSPKSEYAQQLRGDRRGDRDFSYRRRYNPNLLTCSTRTRHTPLTIERFRETKPGFTEPISRFFKLDARGLCNTLRAGTPSSRGAFTSPRPVHYQFPRCITVREAARLHSYPDWFRFHSTKWHGFRQIGNSVPPLLARAVAAEILRASGISRVPPKPLLPLGNVELLTFKMTRAARHYQVSHHTIAPRQKVVVPSRV
ncbi:DNA cytosine methyltransferase [Synechococcus sp. PCC 7336]|uniref:DNA cytosine methyltransferase n=1 Tax=Synechococcus sp. PCC 7336 TaxID=195250 RepID=UPI00034A6F0E|nr:DNA cytosine methyltransferase [Synechococcus sp. PCC 7336]